MRPIKKGKLTIVDTIFNVLQSRPFCKCSRKEIKLYSAWCQRVGETVEMILEEQENK